jgi:hypothetical protein
MGKDISLILSPGKILIDIVKAAQEPDPVTAILGTVSPPRDELYASFPTYLKDILDNDLKDTIDFNTKAGFIASWILSSVKPAWYLRNCSVSLFLESQDATQEQWTRYTSDWKPVAESVLPNLDIQNHFADVNYSVGCLISPENCKNFVDDYKSDPNFKAAVDKHFGIFVSGLIDALYSSTETNTELIEVMDIFVVYIMDLQTGRWQINDQYSFTTDTYEETGIALQALSIEAQIHSAQAYKYQTSGDQEKAEAHSKERDVIINSAVKNGNVYVDKVRAKTGLDIPILTPEMWAN